jgi:hypothetical protein
MMTACIIKYQQYTAIRRKWIDCYCGQRKVFCLQEEPDEHGQGKWEGKQEGKSDKRITESKQEGRENGQKNFLKASHMVILAIHSSTKVHEKCCGLLYSCTQHYVKHQLVKNTLPSHHVKHDDTRVPSN